MSINIDLLDRLCDDFSPLLPGVVIEEVVAQCRDELTFLPSSAMPEMLERLVRHRLDFLDTSDAWMS
jgi:hypothetical protein